MSVKDDKLVRTVQYGKQIILKHKRHLIILTALGMLGGFLEVVGINAVIPLFSFVVKGGDGIVTDKISLAIQQFFGYMHLPFDLKFLLIFISLLFIFKACITLLCLYLNTRITTGCVLETRSDLFKKTLRAKWGYLMNQKVGYLEKVLMRDANASASLLSLISNVILLLTSVLMYLLVAFNISASITLIALLLGAVLFLVFKPLLYKIRELAKQTVVLGNEIAHNVNETIIGMKTVKTLTVEKPLAVKGIKHFTALRSLGIRISMLGQIHPIVMQPITFIFIAMIFGASYYFSPNFNLPSFIVVVYLIQRIFTYFESLQASLRKMSTKIPLLQNTMKHQTNIEKYREEYDGVPGFVFNEGLEFKNVGFAYASSKPVLFDINLTLRKGEMIGLIGPSGAGKTTIVDLLLRLFEPSQGQITLDGKNIADRNLKDWRGHIGYVSQDVFLINDTIENNIKFYDESVSKEDMIKASKMANIYDFICALNEGFAFGVGERGLLLSAGQRQRVALARILARKPSILLLDEATSALDNESEAAIQQAIEGLKGKMTILVIAHRLSSVLNSDRLIVLDKGRIIEQGAPSDLLHDKRSYFYKVYNIRQ